jgi:hypothetical protein
MQKLSRWGGLQLLAILCALPLSAGSAAAQTAPPIQGVTGTIATDATIRSEHEAAHKIAEGAAHVVNGAKKILPGGKGTTDQDPLDALITGSRVVMRDVANAGDAPTTTTDGVVIDVNRSRKQITIRLADKKTQTLRVKDAAATGARVTVSLADQAGAKTYDFTRVS